MSPIGGCPISPVEKLAEQHYSSFPVAGVGRTTPWQRSGAMGTSATDQRMMQQFAQQPLPRALFPGMMGGQQAFQAEASQNQQRETMFPGQRGLMSTAQLLNSKDQNMCLPEWAGDFAARMVFNGCPMPTNQPRGKAFVWPHTGLPVQQTLGNTMETVGGKQWSRAGRPMTGVCSRLGASMPKPPPPSQSPMDRAQKAMASQALLLSEMEDAWGRDESWMAVPSSLDEPCALRRQDTDIEERDPFEDIAAKGPCAYGPPGDVQAARDECSGLDDFARSEDLGSEWSDDVMVSQDGASGLVGMAARQQDVSCGAQVEKGGAWEGECANETQTGAAQGGGKGPLQQHLQEELFFFADGPRRTQSLQKEPPEAAQLLAAKQMQAKYRYVQVGCVLREEEYMDVSADKEKALSDGSLHEKRRLGPVSAAEAGGGDGSQGMRAEDEEMQHSMPRSSPAKRTRFVSPPRPTAAEAAELNHGVLLRKHPEKLPAEQLTSLWTDPEGVKHGPPATRQGSRLGRQCTFPSTMYNPYKSYMANVPQRPHLDTLVDSFRAQNFPEGAEFLPIPRIFRGGDV